MSVNLDYTIKWGEDDEWCGSHAEYESNSMSFNTIEDAINFYKTSKIKIENNGGKYTYADLIYRASLLDLPDET